MTHSKRFLSGFTLSEMITVIAIVGALAAVLVPSFIGYTSSSQRAACETNAMTVRTTYYSEIAADTVKGVDYAALSAAAESVGAGLHDGELSGVCPAGGVYRSFYNDVSGELFIYCDRHGSPDGDASTVECMGAIKNALPAVSSPEEGAPAGEYRIDSADRSGISREISDILAVLGADADSCTWCVIAEFDEEEGRYLFDIYWTDVDISRFEEGTVISVTKYSEESGNYYTATAKVAKDLAGHMVIDTDSAIVVDVIHD